jgi:hypothetical protein
LPLPFFLIAPRRAELPGTVVSFFGVRACRYGDH